jgi:hypothetical protein
MRVLVRSVLPCDADLAWSAVQTSALLDEICAPLIYLTPEAGKKTPERWAPGSTVRMRPRMFGVLPLATRHLHWERIDDAAREIQTREHDAMIRRWDHRIHIEPAGDGQCRYTDDIEIEAGLLTPLVWLYAQGFYRHRQRRWGRVAKRLACQAAAKDSPERPSANLG